MREIKFRAWNKEEKKIDNWKSLLNCNSIWFSRLISGQEKKYHELMQYTGLKDKNGKEIYEGDILKGIRVNWYCPGHPENNTDLVNNYLICWNDEKHAFTRKTIDLARNERSGKFSGEGSLSFNDERADENIIEVIGNLYENPELLKEVKNKK